MDHCPRLDAKSVRSSPFMKPERSLPFLQAPAVVPCPELYESIPHRHIWFI